ncbi:hypothetical protein HLH26_00415 [Gluconacetobacter sp. 1b LMG 1731]|uniref:Uncharacterized protein n=1 Tax=Gluconacetobacter dulcium TaxID=2729096 RepID=A0A7W4NR30_9PROT|nr:hypothetical protein [Gluconacetobacter dulcium]MBB2163017.1 hypothetical protein [Gluconacetobacter dulcium]MBB2192288.1 hypothetical protein [Gluconacetobacter dulcium]MBB2197394.1 hypothetical protein [Gluconacetobacter dulcium]
MNTPTTQHDSDDGGAPPMIDVRPVGTWVVSGVLLVAVLTVWVLVSVIFLHRA